ncbi:MAG: hypothetical protein RSE62_03695 [Citrobacter sp.]
MRQPQRYTYLQGTLYAAVRDEMGRPAGFYSMGNAPRLSVTLGLTAAQYATSQAPAPGSPNYVNLGKANEGQLPTVDVTLESVTRQNLALAMYGASAVAPAGSVDDETIYGYTGGTTPLSFMNLTSVGEVTSATGSVVFVRGRDYSINEKHGTLTVLPGSSIQDYQQLLISYSYAAYEKIDGFTVAPPLLWLRFEGVNMMQEASPVIVDIFKVRMEPIDAVSLIGDEMTSINLKGRVFVDRDAVNPAIKRILSVRQV